MLTVRKAEANDLGAITEIYNEAVLHTEATFDCEAKTVEQRNTWFNEHDTRHPLLVAEQDGVVVGWASLSKWSDRRGYADTVEVSLYVKREHHRKGIGRQLLKSLIEEGRKVGFHTVIGVIAESNKPSIALFESEGFELAGVLKEVGTKFGKLLNVRLFQRIYR